MASGVFGVDRSIWEHPDFAPEPFTQREAWLWLVGAAAYQEKRIRSPRGPITLHRGEFVFSIRFLAEKWRWDRGRVHRFLIMLKNRDMVRDCNRDNQLVYSINNYNRFQIVKAPKRDTPAASNAAVTVTAPRQHRDKEKDPEDSKDRKELDLTSFGLALSAACAAAALEAVRIPTNRFETKAEEVSVSEAQAEEFAKLYPAVDVLQELRAMRGWSLANPTKRKTVRGMPAFINGWLQRQQNRGPVQARASPQSAYPQAQILSILEEPKPQCH